MSNRRDDDGGNWRRGEGVGSRNEEPASVRPKLQLKPRGAPKDAPAEDAPKKDEDAEDKPAAPAAEAPWKSVTSSRFKDDDKEDHEEANKRREEEKREKEEAAAKRREEDAARRREMEEKREARKEELKSAGDGAAKPAGAYVPPSLRQKKEDEAKKQEHKGQGQERSSDGYQSRRGQDSVRQDNRKGPDLRESLPAKKGPPSKPKPEPKQKEPKAEAPAKQPLEKKKEEKSWDEERIAAFNERVVATVEDASADVGSIVEEVPDLLTEAELKTVQPVGRLIEALLRASRQKTNDDVLQHVERFVPLFNCLISNAKDQEVHRFKVKLLCEAQRLAFVMGLPRLSPEWALLEAFYDALYRLEVVEEDYFEMWAVNEKDNTPGKTTAMFQVTFFLEWLRSAKLEGDESSEEEEEASEKDDDGEDDDDDEKSDEEEEEELSDIEANVPKRTGKRLPRV